MALLPPPPVRNDPKDPAFRDWFYKMQQFLATAGNILFSDLDFTGSNLTSILTRNHNDLQNIQGGASNDYYHLTSADKTDLTDGGDSTLHYHASDRDSANFTGTNWTDLTDGGATALHKHDHAAQDNLNSASYYHLTQTNHTDLTDGGDSTLHYHATDRDSANFTGTNWTDLTDGGSTTLHTHAITNVKIYEPTVVADFNVNIGYIASEPLVPDLVTTSTGDIVMAWNGEYMS